MLKRFVAVFVITTLLAFKNQPEFNVIVETDNKNYIFSSEKIIYGVDGGIIKNLDESIEKIAEECYRPAENASLYFDCTNGKGKVKIRKESLGKQIDKDRLKEDVLSALSVGGGTVKAAYRSIIPDFCEKDLIDCDSLKAGFSTNFKGSSESRISNIKLATATLDGLTVYPDETFSFNQAVGLRSEERGYQNAKVIIDGKFTDGVGGGVCQVSTTLYNAMLLAGLKDEEHHSHTIAVNYIEKSFDAMVSYGFADLKMKNISGYPLLIVGNVYDNTLSFKIYGKKDNLTIRRESVIIKTIDPIVNTVFSEQLGAGETHVCVAPKKGYESEGYLIISDGVTTERRFLRKDEYKKVDGVIEIGK